MTEGVEIWHLQTPVAGVEQWWESDRSQYSWGEMVWGEETDCGVLHGHADAQEWQPYTVKEGIGAPNEAFEDSFKDGTGDADFPKDDPDFNANNI